MSSLTSPSEHPLRVAPRPSEVICPVCFERIGETRFEACGVCGALQHAACVHELGGCHGNPRERIVPLRELPVTPWWEANPAGPARSTSSRARALDSRHHRSRRRRRRIWPVALGLGGGYLGVGCSLAAFTGRGIEAWQQLFLATTFFFLGALLALISAALCSRPHDSRSADTRVLGALVFIVAALGVIGVGVGEISALLQ